MNISILILFLVFEITTGIKIQPESQERYCFQLTWPGPCQSLNCKDKDKDCRDETTCKEITCKDLNSINIPCVDPVEAADTLPDFNKIWLDAGSTRESKYACILQKGSSCIKYTYSFNNAVSKAAYYCGKMITNNQTAVQDGCFSQKVGGYDVETCACQSTNYGNGMPCNSSTKRFYSITLLLSVLILMRLF